MPHQADSRSRSDSWPPVQVRIAPQIHVPASADPAPAAAPPLPAVVTAAHAKPVTSPPQSVSLAAPAHDEDSLLIDASDNPLQFFLDSADAPIPRIIQDTFPTPSAAELDTELFFDTGIEEPSPSLPRLPRAKSPHPNYLSSSSSPTTMRRGTAATSNVYSSSEEDSEDSDCSADSRPRSRQQMRLHPAVEAMYDNSSDGEDYERLDAISSGKGYAALRLSTPPPAAPQNSYPPNSAGGRPPPARLGTSPPPLMPYRHSGLRNEYQGTNNMLLVPAAKGLQPTAHRHGRSLRAYNKRGAVAHSGKWKAVARPPSPHPRHDEMYSIAELPAEEAAATQQEFGSSVGSLGSVASWGSGGSGGIARGRSPVPRRVGSPASFMSTGSTGSSGGYSAAGEEPIGMPMVKFAGEGDEGEEVVQVVRRGGEGGGRRVRFVLPIRE